MARLATSAPASRDGAICVLQMKLLVLDVGDGELMSKPCELCQRREAGLSVSADGWRNDSPPGNEL